MTHNTVAASDSLQITVEDGEQGTVVHLHGRLSIDSSPAFRDQLLAMLRESPKTVIVNLTDVSYIDASGIATLLEGLKIARNRLTTFCLRGLQGRVAHLFEVTGVLALFETNGCRSLSAGSKVS